MEQLIAVRSLNVNSRRGSHTTALHAALVKGDLDVASLLLTNGTDHNSRDHCGKSSPLHRVSQDGHLIKVQSTLEIA